MNTHGYTYEGAREASERVHWKVEDLIGGDKHLDFSKPFMPDYFARLKKDAAIEILEAKYRIEVKDTDPRAK